MNLMTENQRTIIRWALDNQANVIGVVPCFGKEPIDPVEWLRFKVGDMNLSGLQAVWDHNHIYFICRTPDILKLKSKFMHENRGTVLIKNIETEYSRQIAEMKQEMRQSIKEIQQ